MNQSAPVFSAANPDLINFVTNLTRVTTLVCDPHIQIVPRLARDFGGIVDLGTVPAEYSAGVGNLDQVFTSYMVYNYAVQQATDIVGIFRPYFVFGQAAGNATLTSDPSNPITGTVPRSAVEIGHAFVRPSFHITLLRKLIIATPGCIYRIRK